jgi:HSP20 family molecular chaperone IbpA
MSVYYARPSRHSPFHDLRDALRSFQDSPMFQLSRNLDGAYSEVARPALDWHETEKAFEIKADVPGIPKEDIKLSSVHEL